MVKEGETSNCALNHDVGFLQAGSEAKIIASKREANEDMLEVLYVTGNKSSTVGKEDVIKENLMDFGLTSESGRIEKCVIRACVEEDVSTAIEHRLITGNCHTSV